MRKTIAKRLKGLTLAVIAGALSSGGVSAAAPNGACRLIDFEGLSYTVCEARADQDLRLFLNDAQGKPLGSFARVEGTLDGRKLVFAMNAGMYHSDRSPVGFYQEGGRGISPLVTRAGPGNFGMLPNGVFCINAEGGFTISESNAFGASPTACRDATQSGPMLVIDGALHPRFLPDSTSRYTRNGVGVSADGQTAYFVISQARVTFHEFGRFFKDGLGLRQALYFDGNISRLYAPEMGRNDFGFPMGPIVGLVAD